MAHNRTVKQSSNSHIELLKSFRGVKVLITGHTGFKGSWLTKLLLQFDAKVSGFALPPPTTPSLFEDGKLATSLAHDIRGDVRSEEAVMSAIEKTQPEIVFHLAAQPLVRHSLSAPVETFATNVLGTAHVLEGIRKSPSVRAAVIITSDKVYENVGWPFGYREIDRLGGTDPYSASKAASEIVFSSYVRSFFTAPNSPQIVSLRAGNVIGGGDWAKDRLVPDMIRAWSKNESVVLRQPQSVRPWQHVLEPTVAYALAGATLLKGQSDIHGQSFNVGPERGASIPVLKIAEIMREKWGPGAELKIEPSVDNREHQVLHLDNSLFSSTFGWKPSLTVDQAVEWSAMWYKAHLQDPESAAKLINTDIQNYLGLVD